jgi:hypothetical protein
VIRNGRRVSLAECECRLKARQASTASLIASKIFADTSKMRSSRHAVLAVLVVVVTALGSISAQLAYAHAVSERDHARRDAIALIRAYRVAADGGSGTAVCQLSTTTAVHRLGGLEECSRLVSNGARGERAYFRALHIARLVMGTDNGAPAATVVLAPKINGDYWQWVLHRERGRYRLARDIG